MLLYIVHIIKVLKLVNFPKTYMSIYLFLVLKLNLDILYVVLENSSYTQEWSQYVPIKNIFLPILFSDTFISLNNSFCLLYRVTVDWEEE